MLDSLLNFLTKTGVWQLLFKEGDQFTLAGRGWMFNTACSMTATGAPFVTVSPGLTLTFMTGLPLLRRTKNCPPALPAGSAWFPSKKPGADSRAPNLPIFMLM